MAKPKAAVDPLFAALAATAPRLDLEWYLKPAVERADTYDEHTQAVIRDMLALHAELSGPKPGSVASQKRRAWQLIARFKAATAPWRDGQAAAWRAAIDAANAVYDAEVKAAAVDLITVSDGTILTLEPNSDAGRAWLKLNVPDFRAERHDPNGPTGWAAAPYQIDCEPSCASDIIKAATADGLTVRQDEPEREAVSDAA